MSFTYQNGELHCENVPLGKLAEEFGTPLYVYSENYFLNRFKQLRAAFANKPVEICYAIKACSNIAVLRALAKVGAGFDVVSGGELYRVSVAGGDISRCLFAGVGKSRDEIRMALSLGIRAFNVESEAELILINEIAAECRRKAPISLRLNPDVDANTHKKISTGKSENKFGIELEKAAEILHSLQKGTWPNLTLRGLQSHIGSQILDLGAFTNAAKKLRSFVTRTKEEFGEMEFFSFGGGLGVNYENPPPFSDEKDFKPSAKEYAKVLLKELDYIFASGLTMTLEPGRWLSANAGALLTRALFRKRNSKKQFLIVDAAMNDLLRPSLYQAKHRFAPVRESALAKLEVADIVGPVCESGDYFAQSEQIPDLETGEYLALLSAGAYAFSMASNYNSRPLPAEVLVNGKSYRLIRKRQNYEDLLSGETC